MVCIVNELQRTDKLTQIELKTTGDLIQKTIRQSAEPIGPVLNNIKQQRLWKSEVTATSGKKKEKYSVLIEKQVRTGVLQF